tara:strand:- start:359 stop:1165 length:807 start_codon:yes stop_codon:yes gene_type:complete
MAETLTFENTTEATTIDNLSAEEQDSLEVGEAMQEAQDQRLAGKYENAQELEKAYIELEKKLGEKSKPNTEKAEPESAEPEAKTETDETETEAEGNPTAELLETLYEQATSKDGYSKETLEQLQQSKPEDIANLYLEYRNNNETQSKDFSEQDVQELKGVVGGDENYKNMLAWAQQNLTDQEVGMFDTVMERGDPLAAFFAVRSLAYRYNDAIGYDGKMVTGKSPKQNNDVFRSQAEVVAAMGDKRYDNDPAYRRDIMEKLSRSDVNF